MQAIAEGFDHAEALELLTASPRLQLFHFASRQTAMISPTVLSDVLVFPWPFDAAVEGDAAVVAHEHVASLPPAIGTGSLFVEAVAEGTLIPLGKASRGPNAPTQWAKLPIAKVRLKRELGQDLPPETRSRLCAELWARGLPEDPLAIRRVMRTNPDTPTPPFLEGPEGVHLLCQMRPDEAEETIDLLFSTWIVNIPRESWIEGHRHSSAWVGARDDSGVLIATGRAMSDWTRNAWIYDVSVRADWRRKRVGEALMRVLLEHPALRGVAQVSLRSTDMARGLYARLGFRANVLPQNTANFTEMALVRGT